MSAWQRSATDSTSGLQGAGGVGLRTYLSSTSNNAPVVASFDDLVPTVPEAPSARLLPRERFR